MKHFLITLFVLGFLCISTFAQSDLRVKPVNAVRISWTPSTETDVTDYAIFYCQGADTTLFPLYDGVHPDQVWFEPTGETVMDWWLASIRKTSFIVEFNNMPGVTYGRIGVAAINEAGEIGVITCIPKVIRIKRPDKVPEVWAQ